MGKPRGVDTASATVEVKPGIDKLGLVYALSGYAAWGFFPLYWRLLAHVDALQILSCRIVFSLALVWVILSIRGKAAWPLLLKERKVFFSLLFSALLIGINWGLYIWAVNSGHTVEASLGYYINPLVSVALGLIFFRERLTALQWVAVAFALCGVILAGIRAGGIPWISLALALSFGLYGLAKKRLALDSLSALAAETLMLAPLALVLLGFRGFQENLALFLNAQTAALLILAGLVTALPLLWFAQGARRLPLSTLGFTQYISPSIQLCIGIFVFKESFSTAQLLAFSLVWLGLALYSMSFFIKARQA